jgi:hypothetical protein
LTSSCRNAERERKTIASDSCSEGLIGEALVYYPNNSLKTSILTTLWGEIKKRMEKPIARVDLFDCSSFRKHNKILVGVTLNLENGKNPRQAEKLHYIPQSTSAKN